MNKDIRKTNLKDLSIRIYQAPDDTLNYELKFTDEAKIKNPDLFKVMYSNLEPREKIIMDEETSRILITSLPDGFFYNHFLHQIIKMIESGKANLDLSHTLPLTHAQSVGDIKSSHTSHERKKETRRLNSIINALRLR